MQLSHDSLAKHSNPSDCLPAHDTNMRVCSSEHSISELRRVGIESPEARLAVKNLLASHEVTGWLLSEILLAGAKEKVDPWHIAVLGEAVISDFQTGGTLSVLRAIQHYPLSQYLESEWFETLLVKTVSPEGSERVKSAIDRAEENWAKVSSAHFKQTLWQYSLEPQKCITLATVRDEGILVGIEVTDELREQVSSNNDSDIPLVALLKREPIWKLGDFNAGLASIFAHDMFDHLFCFQLCEREGLIEKYNALLSKLGDPQDRNIFSREAELVAGIGLGWRSFRQTQPAEESFISSESVLGRISVEASINQKEVYLRMINGIEQDPNDKHFRTLVSYVASRQHAQKRGSTFRVSGIPVVPDESGELSLFDLLDPEYLAFSVDLLGLLERERSEADRFMYMINVIGEDVLEQAFIRGGAENVKIPFAQPYLDELFTAAEERLSIEKREWFKRYPYNLSVGYKVP